MAERPESLETIEITDAHNLAFDLGKDMLRESISVGRELCKFMIGFATGAVPIYLALISLFLPEGYDFRWWQQLLIGIPVIMFLLAAMEFAHGYMPTTDPLDPDDLTAILDQRDSTIERRSESSDRGMHILVGGIAIGSAVLIFVVPNISSVTP